MLSLRRVVALLTLLLACTAAASVAYYFGWYRPGIEESEIAEQRRGADAENARRCDADGRKFCADFVNGRAAAMLLPGWEIRWGEPETHYSHKSATCLVNIPAVQRPVTPPWLSAMTSSLERNQIVDVNRNRVILYGWFERKPEGQEILSETPDPGVPNYTSEKYLAEKRRLFGE